MSRYNRRNSVSKTFKDYLVPIIGGIVILLILFSLFSGDSDTATDTTTTTENRIGSSLVLSDSANAFIEYTGNKKEEILANRDVFKGEKVIIKEGSALLTSPTNTKINVNKLWELKLNEDGSYALFSGDIWVQAPAKTSINLRYGTVELMADTVASFTQNEVGSTIYILKGSAEAKNLSGQSVLLGAKEKVTISRSDASNAEVDLSLAKKNLDTFFQKSDWFIKNNGGVYLREVADETTSTGSTNTSSVSSISGLLTFTNLEDEGTVNTDTVTLAGTFISDDIGIITIDGKTATINTENKSFEVKGISTKQKENDLIVKVYSSSRELLSKEVFTLYYTGGQQEQEAIFKVENFSLDATKFQFISPKQNPYTTAENVVMIEWRVPAGIVQKVVVNDFTLKKFPQYGTYWKYFANTEFGNLKDGLNIYKVEYFGKDGNLLHSNAFTIVKNTPKVVSNEASAQ